MFLLIYNSHLSIVTKIIVGKLQMMNIHKLKILGFYIYVYIYMADYMKVGPYITNLNKYYDHSIRNLFFNNVSNEV